MSRLHYYAAMTFLVASLVVMVVHGLARSGPELVVTPNVQSSAPAGPVGWFQAMKPYCNTVEVELALKNNPAPAGTEGIAYAAACLALAGRIDGAREAIAGLPVSERARAAGV